MIEVGFFIFFIYVMQVKKRTANANDFTAGSHVMEYGNTSIKAEKLYLYQGFDPATVKLPPHDNRLDMHMEVVNQRDAELFFMWQMVSSFSSFLSLPL